VPSLLARAHGRAGNRYAVDAASAEAFDQLGRARPEDDPPWIYWCDEADLSGMVGEAYAYLGDTERAERCLRRAVELMDPAAHPRDRVLLLTRLASVHLPGDIERACAAGAEAVDVAAGLDSPRVAGHIADLQARLAPFAGHLAVAELRERAAAMPQARPTP